MFHVLKIDSDNVRMSKFIEEKLHIPIFEDSKAFYEFTETEDLLYYKEVIQIDTELLDNKVNIGVSLLSNIYHNVPGNHQWVLYHYPQFFTTLGVW